MLYCYKYGGCAMKVLLKRLKNRIKNPANKKQTKTNASLNPVSCADELKYNIIYAYRYLLNREPENAEIINNNTKSWEELVDIIKASQEYKIKISSDLGQWVPAGHYYSPLPDQELYASKEIYDHNLVNALHGIETNLEQQIQLCSSFQNFVNKYPYAEPKSSYRYVWRNDFFSYTDAFVLYSFILHNKPKKIIEIGSGYSSACILDVNQLFFNNEIECTFIEPYPDRLHSLLKESDFKNPKLNIRKEFLQNINCDIFAELEAGDILFIDSSHVSKFGSDVNMLFFKILPLLKKGVLVHIHDVIYPFDYPHDWLLEGRAWNESYVLRAFLQYNETFSLKFWANYLAAKSKKSLDILGIDGESTSIWIEKCA